MAIQKRFGGGHGPHGPPLGTPLKPIIRNTFSAAKLHYIYAWFDRPCMFNTLLSDKRITYYT